MRQLRGLLIAEILFALVSASVLSPAEGRAAETGFSFALDRTGAAAGDTVRLNVLAQRGAENAAGFRLRISYDEDVLRFLGTETSGPTNGTLRTNSSSDPIYSVYVCNVGGGSAPELSGRIAAFVFQVKDGAAAGGTQIDAQADEVCDFDGDAIDAGCTGSIRLNVTALSSEALLTGLVPSQGALQPAFSPDVTDYTLAVGAGIGSVTFEADAASGGAVKISRKSLGAAGSKTQVVATATSADKSAERQYFILVSRAAKAESAPAAKSSPPPVSRAGGENAVRPGAQTATSKGAKPSSSSSAKNPANSAAGVPSAQGTADGGAPSALPEQTALQAERAEGPAPLNIVQNRMPTYFTGMFACAFCMSAGVAVFLWLSAKPKG